MLKQSFKLPRLYIVFIIERFMNSSVLYNRQGMKKNISSKIIFGIATILSFLLIPYTVVPVLRIFVPLDLGLAAIAGGFTYAPPLLILIIPLLPIIVTKIFNGNKKYIILLIFYIIFFSLVNLYNLSKEKKLFTIPFLRSNFAPITRFELEDIQKKFGVKFYTPTQQIQDFKPQYYMSTMYRCDGLDFCLFHFL